MQMDVYSDFYFYLEDKILFTDLPMLPNFSPRNFVNSFSSNCARRGDSRLGFSKPCSGNFRVYKNRQLFFILSKKEIELKNRGIYLYLIIIEIN